MNFTPEQEQRIVDTYLGGMSTNSIAKQLRFHKSYAVRVLSDRDIPLRFQTFGQLAREFAKLYTEDLLSGPEIARRFNTTATTVYAALRRQGIMRRPPHNGFIGDCDHQFFARIDREQKSYFLGAMGGDGNVFDNEISFSLKDTDVALVDRFRRALKIGNSVRYDERTKEFRRYRFRYRRAVVSVCSWQLAHDLARYGVVPAKTGQCVPALIPQQVPHGMERHYWRGWVDTDAWLVRLNETGQRQQLITRADG
jgi:hypothetical protein